MSRSFLASLCVLAGSGLATPLDLPPGHPSIRILARAWAPDSATRRWSWSGSGAQVAFEGGSCSVRLEAPGTVYRVLVDGIEGKDLDLSGNSDTLHTLASGLGDGPHLVEIRQKTEAQYGIATFRGFRIEGPPAALPAPSTRRIEFYGNSITCGYGILDSVAEHPFSIHTEDEGLTFAARAADTLGAERRTVCWSGKGVVQNYGRDTVNSTLPELHDRILPWDAKPAWDFTRWIPDVVVIDLGTNDFSHVAPDSTMFHRTYLDFVRVLHSRYPAARFVLVEGPMLSDGYPAGLQALTKVRSHLENIVAALSREGVQATHLSLSPQTGSLGLGADYHPSRKQAAFNSRELAAHLASTMGWNYPTRRTRAPARHSAILRSPDGLSLRAPSDAPLEARLVDTRGRIGWRGSLQAGTSIRLPRSSSPRWVQWSTEGLSGILPIPGDPL